MNEKDAAWPHLNYDEFKSTAHLLHMGVQIIGKFKLYTPFEPHWANVALWLTAKGITTGLIPYQSGAFSIEVDLNNHLILVTSSFGTERQFPLTSMSVAEFETKILMILKDLNIDLHINSMPQEIPNPIPFNEDTEIREYNSVLANAWWRILLSSYKVMKLYHARFDGETPPIGLMWGTFDLRDARYNGMPVPTTGVNAGYIRRNAMDEAQVEIGFWHGNEMYPRPAYYSFTYPQPDAIESATIQPQAARWDAKLTEFVLDYEAIEKSNQPEEDLLNFFESTYHAGTQLAQWDPTLIKKGEPS
ncbi:MAG: hypothetical protein H0W64_04515 [Gammaproteobacteria bacterium]|nr:hypothetical protein [Gammaproteobacteria bacterium]